jgi:hypothetical protein
MRKAARRERAAQQAYEPAQAMANHEAERRLKAYYNHLRRFTRKDQQPELKVLGNPPDRLLKALEVMSETVSVVCQRMGYPSHCIVWAPVVREFLHQVGFPEAELRACYAGATSSLGSTRLGRYALCPPNHILKDPSAAAGRSSADLKLSQNRKGGRRD